MIHSPIMSEIERSMFYESDFEKSDENLFSDPTTDDYSELSYKVKMMKIIVIY